MRQRSTAQRIAHTDTMDTLLRERPFNTAGKALSTVLDPAYTGSQSRDTGDIVVCVSDEYAVDENNPLGLLLDTYLTLHLDGTIDIGVVGEPAIAARIDPHIFSAGTLARWVWLGCEAAIDDLRADLDMQGAL